MSQEGKFLLESILGKLLGFDEGAGDLLNHLLTIESEEDLKEYLSQLLGSETPETKEFVLNVGRYQRGEKVLYKIEKEDEKKEEESAKAISNQVAHANSAASNGTNANAKQNKQNTKKAALQARRNQKQGKKGKVPPPSKKATALQSSNSSQSTAAAAATPASSTVASQPTPATAQSPAPTPAPPVEVQKSRPQRGKAEFVCGCMGSRDKPLTNCLYCGRIVCEREGYGYCPYCGYLIEEITARSSNGDESWAQKERLLRFDREFARRTKIFDDQADYQGPATWMSEEERVAAQQKQQDRLEEMRRPKQLLNLNI